MKTYRLIYKYIKFDEPMPNYLDMGKMTEWFIKHGHMHKEVKSEHIPEEDMLAMKPMLKTALIGSNVSFCFEEE